MKISLGIKRIFRTGGSFVLPIPRFWIENVRSSDDLLVEVTLLDDKSLIVKPTNQPEN